MKFAVIAVVMVVMAGVFHMMFIMFDYGFFNPDTGGFVQLSDKLNESMLPEYRNQAYNQSQLFKWFFGMGRVICIVLCPVFGMVELFVSKRQVGGG